MPAEVKAFLDAVDALPEEATKENFEEVSTLMAACQDAYDALAPEDLEREDVLEAIKKMAGLMEAAMLLDEVDSVAAVGDTRYTTLQEAIDAATNGETVTLLKDVDLTDLPGGYHVYDISGMVLDLNGKTITAANNNGSKTGTGGYLVFQGKNAKITNGTFAVTDGNYALFIGDEDDTDNFVVENVTAPGVNIYNATNVTLREVTSAGKAYYSVWCDENGHVTIESGNYSSASTKANTLFGVAKGKEPDGNGSMKITGGTFTLAEGQKFALDGNYLPPAVSGGTFSADVQDYVVEGYMSQKIADNKYVVVTRDSLAVAQVGEQKYLTLQEAIDAATNGDTVTLLANLEVESTLTISGTVTVNGNGFTLSRKSDGAAGSFKTMRDKTNVRKEFATTGTINFSMFTVAANGSLTLNGVKVDEGVEWTRDKADELDTCTGPMATKPLIKLGKDAKLDLTGCEIKGIHADCEGGIIDAKGAAGSVTTITGTSVTGCVGNSCGLVYRGEGTTNATVNLNRGAAIEGNYNYAHSNHAMFKIYNGTTMTMSNGSSVSDNYHHGNGGAIGLWGAGSTLVMNGGQVNGNRFVSVIQSNSFGTPIYGHQDSTIIMNGGEVCKNEGWSLTGLCFFDGKGPVKVELNGGTISGNTTADPNYQTPSGLSFRSRNDLENDYVIGNGMTVDTNVWLGNMKKPIVNNATINGNVDFRGTSTLVNHGTVTGQIAFYVAGKDSVIISDTRLTQFLVHKDLTALGYVVIETDNNNGTWTYALGKVEEGKTISVALDKAADSVTVGNSTTLTATVTDAPEGAMVKWTSDDENVATVNANGVVTGVSAGTATITAKVGGVSATCTVTVTVPVTGVTLDQTGLSMTVGYTVSDPITLTATVAPEDTTEDKTVTWTSDNEAVATVDANGVVTAVASGTANITAKVGGVTATCTVTVTTTSAPSGGGDYSYSGGGTGGGTTVTPPVEIDEPDVPLAELPLPFADMTNDDWYREAVAFMYKNGLMVGVSDDLFGVNTNTTRGMMAAVIYRLEKEPNVTFAKEFADVDNGKWYSLAVTWANANRVAVGYDNGSFGPDDNVTREQLVAMLYRYAANKGFDVSKKAELSKFADAGKVSGYARDAMSWAVSEGIIVGRSEDTLAPTAQALRVEVASIFQRFAVRYMAETFA